MTGDRVDLSERQLEIMEIVWEHKQISVFEVRELIGARRTVARTTIRTMMERMEAKGWLTHRVIGRTRFYSACVTRENGLGKRVADIVDRICGGQPERLMTALLDYRGLSAIEASRIRALLDEAKPPRGKKKKGER